MRITGLETVRILEHPNCVWLLIHTDQGLHGLGETFLGARAVEAYIHEEAAPRLIGEDPLRIDHLARTLVGYLGTSAPGAETRGNSAIDIALWDLFGKWTGQSVAQLLGGFTRDAIRTYNTCAGTNYMRDNKGQRTQNYGLAATAHPYQDLQAFLTDAGELAASLLEDGITAMKIWPFDAAAEASNGYYIGKDDLRRCLEPFEKIRRRVGDRMEVMVEFHSMWQLGPAIEIARALEPYGTFWHEDPIRMDCLDSLKRYAEASRTQLCASETLATRSAFRDLLVANVAGVIMLDLSWCGGISEARKIAAMAESWKLPVAPHDCTGPVVLAASTHLSLNAPNALVQESVRAFYRTWYRDIVTAVPEVSNGMITVPPGPGLGLDLLPDLDRHFSVERKISGKCASGHQGC